MVETLGETLRLSDGRDARKTEPGPRPFLYCVLELDRLSGELREVGHQREWGSDEGRGLASVGAAAAQVTRG